MKLLMTGCSHHNAPVEIREQLAFSPGQVDSALEQLRDRFPEAEAVVLSTCNRVEIYIAANEGPCPAEQDVLQFVADFHSLDPEAVRDAMQGHVGEDAVRHLFQVAASLDSMVVGEAQILSQVKQAYEIARVSSAAGPITNAAFQAALRVAKRVASETAINERRVSIPSVAVADFASQIFERFDDKHVLVIGAGEMGEETLRYLMDEGANEVTVVNRNPERAADLASRVGGRTRPWSELHEAVISADLVIGTTGSTEPILTATDFAEVQQQRSQRPIFMLDLAVPRDFEAGIGDLLGVYLYSIDDLKQACEANRRAREKEWPKAQRIIEAETARFLADARHQSTGPTIQRLKNRANELKDDELKRLMNKLRDADDRTRQEIERSFERLVNKLLHPPLESLRDDAASGAQRGLLEALKHLFQLKD